jgi:hypothetical protein
MFRDIDGVTAAYKKPLTILNGETGNKPKQGIYNNGFAMVPL